MAAADACDCGRVIVQPATGRRRTKCAVCSPPDTRDRRRAPAPVTTLPGGGEHPLVTRTRADLGDLADTAEGMILLQLAAAIAAGGGSPTGLVRLSERYETAKRALLALAVDDADDDGIEWGVG
jgi:hypothetical protein